MPREVEEESSSAQVSRVDSVKDDDAGPSFPGSFNFPSVPTTAPSVFPSLPANLIPLPLASSSAAVPLQPLTNFSFPSTSAAPVKKSAPPSARKTRTAAKGAGVKSSKSDKVELESKARKVMAKRAVSGGMKKGRALGEV